MKIFIEWDPDHPNGHAKIFYDPNLEVIDTRIEGEDVWVRLREK